MPDFRPAVLAAGDTVFNKHIIRSNAALNRRIVRSEVGRFAEVQQELGLCVAGLCAPQTYINVAPI